jgi:hypothetical protein
LPKPVALFQRVVFGIRDERGVLAVIGKVVADDLAR